MTEHDKTFGPHEDNSHGEGNGHGKNNDALYTHVCTLVHKCLSGAALPAEVDELERLVCDDPQARRIYVALMHETRSLRRWAAAEASPARETAADGGRETSEVDEHRDAAVVEKAVVEKAVVGSAALRSVPHSPPSRLRFLVVAATLLVAVGIVVYAFWPKRASQPVAGEPAAQVTSSTDAQWLGPLRPKDGAIAAGERLVLERGSVEITFSRQARMIIEAPTDVVIVDGGTCRLASGKLTAYAPTQAKGFQVLTPDGTVTDLGTEFGVYVRDQAGGDRLEAGGEAEHEQPAIAGPQQDGKQAPTTEVHVFRGQVEFNQALAETNSKSATGTPVIAGHPQFTILQTGQAVTISENKVQPLPAADPFQFALDKLNGSPRQVLLKEDFEGPELGTPNKITKTFGPWSVQSGTRKGQGAYLCDPEQKGAETENLFRISIPRLSPAAPVGQRCVALQSSYQMPKNTFPLLIREIDGRALTGRGQVLVEFDLFPAGGSTCEPSLAFVRDVAFGDEQENLGFALWKNADPPPAKIEWPEYRWQRVRLLLDVAGGRLRGARVDRWQWSGADRWKHDLTFKPPLPKVDWTQPPRYAVFGFPVAPDSRNGGNHWIDNIRVEAISEN